MRIGLMAGATPGNNGIMDLVEFAKDAENRGFHSLWLAKKEREGVTQRDMAKELGWTVGTAGQYMLGRIPLNANAISRFAKYLGVSPYDIDPSLAENFIVPPDDLIDVEKQLEAMAPDDLRRLIGDLSRRLPQQDLLRLVALLADRATERR